MEMNWFSSMIFGIVSGLTEILPVSAPAHEILVNKLFGMDDNALLRLITHAAVWEALYLYLRGSISQLMQERQLSRVPPRRRVRQPDPVLVQEGKLLRTALFPMLLGFVASWFLRGIRIDLSSIAVFLAINGMILYIPGHIPSANKDARSMTPLDGLLLGISAAAGVLPGVSRTGSLVSVAGLRGADKEHSLRWALLLNLGAMLVVMGFDAYDLLTYGMGPWNSGMILSCFLAFGAAFLGASLSIRMMSFLAFRTGFSGFAYYSWGAALFAFLMYLTI